MGAVVFDMDGVIFDSEKLVLAGWLEIAEEYKIPDVKELYYQCLGTNAKESREIFLKHYGKDFPYDFYKKEMSRRFHERYDNGRLPLKPGVVRLLSFFCPDCPCLLHPP